MRGTLLFLVSCLSTISTGVAFHCSNDAPTQVTVASPEKIDMYDIMPVHLLNEIHHHNHPLHPPGHVHEHPSHRQPLPAPGYNAAENEMHRALRHRTQIDSSSPVTPIAEPLRLDTVHLLPGGRGYAAQNLTLQWLKMFNPDSLLYSFRVTGT